jgi:hypothetical protein
MSNTEVLTRLAAFVAELAGTPVMSHNDGKQWAVVVPCPETSGLAFVTLLLKDKFEQNGYIDVQTRRYIGELSDDSFAMNALIENYTFPDATYGVQQTDQSLVLVLTDNYRLLLNWGEPEMLEALKIRVGGMLATPTSLSGISALQKSTAKQVMRSLGFI